MSKTVPTLRQYMTPSPHTIGVEQPLMMASKLMREHHLRHLPVLRGGRLVGLLSERELALVESLEGVDAAVLRVEEAMIELPWTTTPDAPLDEVVATMAEHRYGAAVALEGGRVVGIFTTVDACRALAALLRS